MILAWASPFKQLKQIQKTNTRLCSLSDWFRAGCCSWCGGGGGAALRRVIQVSVDPLKWKSGQEKMYCDSIK